MSTDVVAIPEPRGYPIIGNIADIDPEFSNRSFLALSEKYGDIYRLRFPEGHLIIVSTVALVDDICDEDKFMKVPRSVLTEIRNGVHDGLFTAHITEPNWGIAHRILMPAFGPQGIRNMFPEMHDVASQLVMKWARQGPRHRIHLTDDFTRLALDTLALCSMGFRFNNFYSDAEHPFVCAMLEFLTESGRRTQRFPLPSIFYRKADEAYESNIKILRETAESVLRERIANGDGKRNDLLAAMLRGIDSQTGEKMSEDSIIDNLITFLIAGHETTSGTLSYAIHELLRHPEAYRKVQQEVDQVVGSGPITVQHMQKFPYIEAVLRETLRLDAPISILSRVAREDGTIIGGKYMVNKADTILALLAKSQQDPAVYEEPTLFRPERMLSANFNNLPKNAWKPFGTGVRSCIGRPFAWQESVLALALIFQNFDLELDDPSYILEHKQTLTLKPRDLYIRANLRHGLTPTQLGSRISGRATGLEKGGRSDTEYDTTTVQENPSSQHPLTIFYGSNSGTCELMAQKLSLAAPAHGYTASPPKCLNDGVESIQQHQPVVIFTSSYEGEPPDNAARFLPWVESLKGTNRLSGVRYTVFGCGNSDWPQTFHRVPKLIDAALSAAGAERIAEIGLADAANDDMFVIFENWETEVLWRTIDKVSNIAAVPTLRAVPSSSRSSILGYDLQQARIMSVRRLTSDGEPIKVHLEIELPRNLFFRAGDYMMVLPSNPRQVVMRVMRRFRLPMDANVTLEGTGLKLPVGLPIPVQSLLSEYVELGQPATRKDLLFLTNTAAAGSDEKRSLELLATDGFAKEIAAKRASVLDILEQFPLVDVSLGDFLLLLPAMRTRQYSISSSPSHHVGVASLTVALIKEETHAGRCGSVGVTSSYLAAAQPGDLISVSVRPSHDSFHLPLAPQTTPLIMISAGTGIAPFRGFIQERTAMIQQGIKLAPAFLYHGCRQPGRDDLYADEAVDWEVTAGVQVKRAFSRFPDLSGGCRYIQDVVWQDRHELLGLWRQGCFLFVCGSKVLGRAVAELAVQFKIDIEQEQGREISREAAEVWWNELRNSRYAFDIFD